jgi:hypothetical protein
VRRGPASMGLEHGVEPVAAIRICGETPREYSHIARARVGFVYIYPGMRNPSPPVLLSICLFRNAPSVLPSDFPPFFDTGENTRGRVCRLFSISFE